MKKRAFMLAMIGVLSLTGVPQAAIIGNSTTVTAEAATRLSVPNGLTSIGRTYAQKIISYSSGKISKSSFDKASSTYKNANKSRLKKSNTSSTRSKIKKDSNLLNGLAKKTNSKKRSYITSAVKNATVMPSVSSSGSSSGTTKSGSSSLSSSTSSSKKLTVPSGLTTSGKAFAKTIISCASSKTTKTKLQTAANTYSSNMKNALANKPSLRDRAEQDSELLQNLAKKTGSNEIISVVKKATALPNVSTDNTSSLTVPTGLTTSGRTFANAIISRASLKSSATDFQSAADTYISKMTDALASKPSLRNRAEQDSKLLRNLANQTGSSEIISAVNKATTLPSEDTGNSSSLSVPSGLTTSGRAFANAIISRASSRSSATDFKSATDTYISKMTDALANKPSLRSRAEQDSKLLRSLANQTGSSEIISAVNTATTLPSDSNPSNGSSTGDDFYDDGGSGSDDDDLTNYGWDNSGSGSSDDWGDFSSDDADDAWNFDD